MENNTTNFVNNPDQKMQRYASEMSSPHPQMKVGQDAKLASLCTLKTAYSENQ